MKKKNLIFLLFIFILWGKKYQKSKRNRICVVNLHNSQNVGNILVKFALFKKLKEFGFNPTMIASKNNVGINIDFLNKTTNLIVLKKNFSELNESNYDYIMVNSDQTWTKADIRFFYDIAFLKFAENWTIPKFIYGASIGVDFWFFTKKDEEIAKKLLKNFTGISFRENNPIKFVDSYLGIKSVLVLDPTMLIDKFYYLNEIKNYKTNISFNEKFIFIYQLDQNPYLEKLINESYLKYNYSIYRHKLFQNDYIESFIFGINNSQAVITDSFHGTIFSIIFNKPFITFLNKRRGKGRFDSLNEIFNFENRIIDPFNNKTPDINLLSIPLSYNRTLLNEMKNFSINYLRKNLGIIR